MREQLSAPDPIGEVTEQWCGHELEGRHHQQGHKQEIARHFQNLGPVGQDECGEKIARRLLCEPHEGAENNRFNAEFLSPENNAVGQATRFGAVLLVNPPVSPNGNLYSMGTWAVTAP